MADTANLGPEVRPSQAHRTTHRVRTNSRHGALGESEGSRRQHGTGHAFYDQTWKLVDLIKLT